MNEAKGLKKVLAVLGAFTLFSLSGCGQEQTAETDSNVQATTELASEAVVEKTTEAAAEEHLDYGSQDEWTFESGEMQSRKQHHKCRNQPVRRALCGPRGK